MYPYGAYGAFVPYRDYESSFEQHLSKDGSIVIHQRNLRVMALEMYKITYKLSPEFMWDMVEEMNTKCHTRSYFNASLLI